MSKQIRGLAEAKSEANSPQDEAAQQVWEQGGRAVLCPPGTHANRVALRSTRKKNGQTFSHHFQGLKCISMAFSEKGRAWQGLSLSIPMSKDDPRGYWVADAVVMPGLPRKSLPGQSLFLLWRAEELGLIYRAVIWKEAAFHRSPTASLGLVHLPDSAGLCFLLGLR